MNRNRLIRALMILLTLSALASLAAAQDVVHVVSGVVTKVDSGTKTMAVKTSDGTEHVFKYTENTAVRGAHEGSEAAKAGLMDTYFKGKEGSQVVVHYTKIGGDDVARRVTDLGKDAQKIAKGTITKVDKAGHRVTIKAEEGSEQTYDFGKDASGDSEKGVVRGWDYTETKAKEGDKVVVHYTSSSGKKIVHFFED
jgi:hypothetical protein